MCIRDRYNVSKNCIRNKHNFNFTFRIHLHFHKSTQDDFYCEQCENSRTYNKEILSANNYNKSLHMTDQTKAADLQIYGEMQALYLSNEG